MTEKAEFHYFGTKTEDGTTQGFFFKVSRESSGAGDDYQEEVGIEEIWVVNQVNNKEVKCVMKLPAILDAIVEGNNQLTGIALHQALKMFEDTRDKMTDVEPIIDPFIDAIERANAAHPQDFDSVIKSILNKRWNN
jgi:hypothetical protein